MPREATLTNGPVGRTLISMTGPMVAGLFAITTFNLADTYFVARLGTKELAAMSFTFPVVMFVAAIALGLGMGTASVVSQAIGEGDGRKVQRLTTDSLILCVLIVAAFSTAGIATIEPLFTLLGATSEILPLIKTYMTVWYVGMVFVVVPMVGNNAIRATGDTKYPSLVMMLGAAMNIILDPFLIFGWGFFPRLELSGAALATVISRAVTLTAATLILHFRDRMLHFAVPRLREVWSSWKRILHIGLPSAATNVLVPVSAGVITRMVAGFGEEAVAAAGAGSRIGGFALLLLMALCSVMVPFVGQNWGARRLDRILAARRCSFQFSIVWGVLCVVVLGLAAKTLAGLFSEDTQVTRNIALYLWIVPVGYGLQGVFRLTTMIFNGISLPLHSVGLNLGRMLVLYIPLAYLGGRLFGFEGILGGITLANVSAGVISLILLNYVLANVNARPPAPSCGSSPR